MFGKLLVLLVACGSNQTFAHIVTSSSSHSDVTFIACVKSLTEAVQSTLCPMYGQIGQLSIESMLTLDPREIERQRESRRWEFRNNINKCCSRPCSISELVAIC